MNIGRPEGFSSNELNTRRLHTRAIPVPPPAVPPRSSSVPLERLDRVHKLVDEEESEVELLNLFRNRTCKKETCQF